MISIDVGFRNIGIAIFNGDKKLKGLEHVTCCTVAKPSLSKACADLQRVFGAFLKTLDPLPSEALIELQPRKNIKSKTLSHCVQVMLLGAGIKTVKFVSAPKKGLPLKTTYYGRKQCAIAAASKFLIGSKFYEPFCRLKKKDDVADALVQALKYYNQL